MMHNLHPTIYVIDVAALAALMGSFAGELPSIAAGMAALWYFIAILDALARWYQRWRGK